MATASVAGRIRIGTTAAVVAGLLPSCGAQVPDGDTGAAVTSVPVTSVPVATPFATTAPPTTTVTGTFEVH